MQKLKDSGEEVDLEVLGSGQPMAIYNTRKYKQHLNNYVETSTATI